MQRCGEVTRLRILWSQVRSVSVCPSLCTLLLLLLVLTHLKAACQIVLVADPYIITELLRDKTWDKSKKAYSVMNAVQLCDLEHLTFCTSTLSASACTWSMCLQHHYV